jgi:hypothetical protein
VAAKQDRTAKIWEIIRPIIRLSAKAEHWLSHQKAEWGKN